MIFNSLILNKFEYIFKKTKKEAEQSVAKVAYEGLCSESTVSK